MLDFEMTTWYPDPLLLKDECIDGHYVEWCVDEWTVPCHGFNPTGTILQVPS